MPIVSVDASQLEVRVAALLSQDPVMMQEVRDGVDAHAMNCTEVMELPLTDDNRTAAKTTSFRALYGGTAYAFYMDSKMPNFSLKKWQKIMDNYYAKYKGLGQWQKNNYREVQSKGQLLSPVTGRIWKFKQYKTRDGMQYKWAEVCNYPVQGTSFDFIGLWMVKCIRDFAPYPDIKFIMMVHDELVFDVPEKYVDFVAERLYTNIVGLRGTIEKFFNYPCNIPFNGEVKIGPAWGNLEKYKI